ncbi:MAG TPA: hypothetical protein VES89_05285 [Candidatus Competibacteraceae bacterium]|nr:hypothetical protein [Candidatus Competibacteraceae bacterium]
MLWATSRGLGLQLGDLRSLQRDAAHQFRLADDKAEYELVELHGIYGGSGGQSHQSNVAIDADRPALAVTETRFWRIGRRLDRSANRFLVD